MIRKHQSLILAIIFIFFITCLLFFKIFTKGYYPVPGDLLVSFYFPWYSGSWEGYDPWTTRKELLGADAVRQIYLWKEFAANQYKVGQLPLWNPFTFSGQPLAANFQSSVYYPLNTIYFLTDPKNAWILLVVIQPLLGGLFMYLVTRSFKLSRVSSAFASVAFMFSSYIITWLENANIAHSYIWLPLAIWSINKFFESQKTRFLILLTTAFSMSILGGHPQTAIYIYMASFIYFAYKIFEANKRFNFLIYFIFTVLFSISIAAIQIIPTYDFYKDSPISLPFAKDVYLRSILPYKNLSSFFASDFFGHPANNNFWNESYGDFTPYFGVIPLVFSLWAIIILKKNKFIKFIVIISIFFMMAALRGPITYLIYIVKPPLLDATTPSRFISVSILFLIILSAMGFDHYMSNLKSKAYSKKFLKFLMIIAFIYITLWLFAIFGAYFLEPKDTWRINLAVTRRNLILPTLMFAAVPIITLIIRIIRVKLKLNENQLKVLTVTSLFIVTLVGAVYYSNKFLPMAPKKFIFPDHPLFYWLKNNAQINRFYGGGTAHIDFNFPAHYQIYGVEGYDTLRLKRYSELLASSFFGYVPESYLRSDGVVPNEENGYRKRIFELLGVKYLLDKDDMPKTGADWNTGKFAPDNVQGHWQYIKFQVYKRELVLPRIFLTTKYYLAKSDSEIIEKIYDQNFDLRTIILEKEPPINITNDSLDIVEPQLLKYQPNEVEVKSDLGYNSLLFLSDAYTKDWNVYIDNQKQELLRAHYALRAVAVPTGEHLVKFQYQPKSHIYGASITLISIIALITIALASLYKKIL